MQTTEVIKAYLLEGNSQFSAQEQEWLLQSAQIDSIDEDGLRSKTVYLEQQSNRKITAQSYKLFNLLRFNQFKFLKFFIESGDGGATLIAGMKIDQPVVAIFGFLKLIWGIIGSSVKEYSEFDAEVLFTMYLLGNTGSTADIPGKYKEFFKKDIDPDYLEDALSLLADYRTIARPEPGTYRLVETIIVSRG